MALALTAVLPDSPGGIATAEPLVEDAVADVAVIVVESDAVQRGQAAEPRPPLPGHELDLPTRAATCHDLGAPDDVTTPLRC
jgi:hypothetical protein